MFAIIGHALIFSLLNLAKKALTAEVAQFFSFLLVKSSEDS